MKPLDIILIVIGALWVIGAVGYIIYAHKKGQKCVGCSDCRGDCSCCNKCTTKQKEKNTK